MTILSTMITDIDAAALAKLVQKVDPFKKVLFLSIYFFFIPINNDNNECQQIII